MPIFLRMDMRIWWLTVSKAADRSSKMSTEDLEAVSASLRASVTRVGQSQLSGHSEARLVVVQNVVLCKKQREWLNTTCSSDFAMNGRRDTGL